MISDIGLRPQMAVSSQSASTRPATLDLVSVGHPPIPSPCWNAPTPLSVAPLPIGDWKRKVAEVLLGREAPICCGVRIMAKLAKSTAYLQEAFGSEFSPQISGLNIYQRCTVSWLLNEAAYGSAPGARILAINELDRLVESGGSLPMSVLAENALQRLNLDDFIVSLGANLNQELLVRIVALANKYHNRLLCERSSHVTTLAASFASGRGIDGWLRDHVVPLANGHSSWASQLLQNYWKTSAGTVDFRKLYVLLKAGFHEFNEIAAREMLLRKDCAQLLEGVAFMRELASSSNLEDVIFAVHWPRRNFRKIRAILAIRSMDATSVVSPKKAARLWFKAMRAVDVKNLQRMVASYIFSSAGAPEDAQRAEATARTAIFALQELASYGHERARDYLVYLTHSPVPRLRSMAQAATDVRVPPAHRPTDQEEESDGHE